MQGKFDFDGLPPEIKMNLAAHLTAPDVVNLAVSSTTANYKQLFKPALNAHQLLHHVVRGEHDKVAALLKKNIKLLVQKASVTDRSGRTFETISAFEYALWALDKHMWTLMLNCLSKDEDCKELVAELLTQYEKLNTEGVTYTFRGETITEKHFDFENTIIKELQTQVDSIKAPGVKNWDTIDNQWREGVGGAQKLLPMHVVYEYCSEVPFEPVPEFTVQPKSSKQFINWFTGTYENWFSADSKLAVDFAIFKGGWCGVRLSRDAWGCGAAGGLDLIALTALCKVRTNDFIDLKSQLGDQMTLNNHQQVSQI
ncbi:hypothetical protein BN59_03814 [Legionella massiliensis]|uniref:F-box domain-containing protein n=1 Tax=Legionella massiliensis TaxID=1034943 RepID=A0A078L2U2_9GAMM|nr:hypothetical protein [Legionella massiliensis]CDZ79496.1 hypothetical protein BN59_03814 [Legionella massiliensis]CEE15234.1 hypothetical protein BN1094_03814 [Legionella massiliensis]